MADKNYTTDAINLRSYDLSDADKIIVMYSKDKGLMRSVAKGVKRPKSKLGARMDSLIANTLMFSRGRNLDTICQAQTINPFRKIREDMLKLMFSSYISEIVANYGLEDDPSSEETYKLLYSALEKISSAIEKKDVIIAVIKFQLKMMLISGIIPEFIMEKIATQYMYAGWKYVYFMDVSDIGRNMVQFKLSMKELNPMEVKDYKVVAREDKK